MHVRCAGVNPSTFAFRDLTLQLEQLFPGLRLSGHQRKAIKGWLAELMPIATDGEAATGVALQSEGPQGITAEVGGTVSGEGGDAGHVRSAGRRPVQTDTFNQVRGGAGFESK